LTTLLRFTKNLADIGINDEVDVELAGSGSSTSVNPCHFSGAEGDPWQERQVVQVNAKFAVRVRNNIR